MRSNVPLAGLGFVFFNRTVSENLEHWVMQKGNMDTYDKVATCLSCSDSNTAAEPVDAASSAGDTCLFNPHDLPLRDVVLSMAFLHLSSIGGGHDGPKITFVLDTPRQNGRSCTRVDRANGTESSFALSDNNLVVYLFLYDLEVVSVWIIHVA